MGRKPLGKKALSNAERQKKYRSEKRKEVFTAVEKRLANTLKKFVQSKEIDTELKNKLIEQASLFCFPNEKLSKLDERYIRKEIESFLEIDE